MRATTARGAWPAALRRVIALAAVVVALATSAAAWRGRWLAGSPGLLGELGLAPAQAQAAAAPTTTLGDPQHPGDSHQAISLDQLQLTPAVTGSLRSLTPPPPTLPASSPTPPQRPLGQLGLTRVYATFVAGSQVPVRLTWTAVVRIETRVFSPLRLADSGLAAWLGSQFSLDGRLLPGSTSPSLQLPKPTPTPMNGVLLSEPRLDSPLASMWRRAGLTLVAPAPAEGGSNLAAAGGEASTVAGGAPDGHSGEARGPHRLILAYEGPLGTVLRADYEPAAGSQAPKARLGAEYQARLELGQSSAARISASASVGVDLGELAQDGGVRLPTPQSPSIQAGLAYEMGDKATLTATYRIDAAGVRVERSTQVGIGLNLTDSASLSASYRLVHFATDAGADQSQAQAEASLKLSF